MGTRFESMNDVNMTFDELLTMKALQWKSSLSGRGNGGFISRMVEADPEQAEALGMKNLCFRIHPWLQARLEVTLTALDMSKQEALTEALTEMLNQFDSKLQKLGVGPLDFEDRLRALGYELEPADEHGRRVFRRTAIATKE
jgi:hypothetical protein